ncbi:MAG: SBBP repeat-containing protein, partial [Acidobacteria bacterium]|nr:SBBP repeat-containing protein [Acidobacteriota bacterium]
MLFSKTFGTLGSVTAAFAFGPGDQLYIAGSLPGGALLDPQAPSQKQGPAKGTSAAFVASLDKAGNVLWITYLGGSDSDVAKSMVLDSSGAIYISGYTTSADFPVTARAFQKQTTSVIHAFAAKLDPTGANLLYSTILGATSGPACNVFAVSAVLDGSGGLVVAGYTNCASLPSRAAGGAQPYQKTFAGVYDGFLVKFNADASDLLFLTYLGGPGADTVAQMVKDSDGNFILTGSTQGPSFPTSGAGVITKYSGGLYDAFVTKLDSTGTALIFSTLLGGSGDDQAHSVAVTAQKEILVAGETRSRDFPMKGAVQPLFNGGVRDGFATKLNANGVLSISTYVGTAGDDYVATVAAQADGLVVMTVQTDSLIKSGLSGAPSLLSADNGHQVTLVAFSAEELQNQTKRYDFNSPADGSARNCGFFPITNPPDIAAGYLSYYCCAGSIYQNNQEVAAQSCLITSKNNSKGGIPDFL